MIRATSAAAALSHLVENPMTSGADAKKMDVTRSDLLYSVQNRNWSKSFFEKLKQEPGHLAAHALSKLEKKAVARGANAAGFHELLIAALEEVVFRANISDLLPRHKVVQTLAEIESDIKVLQKCRNQALQPSQEIPREMLYEFRGEVLKRDARVAINELLQINWAARRLFMKDLAAYGPNTNSIRPGKQDTFAVARLRTAIHTFTGHYHDREICHLLEVASRAADRFDDSWNPDKLRKIAKRFLKEYELEPELLPMVLYMMTRQVSPEKSHALRPEWLNRVQRNGEVAMPV